jgi:hypothetical protein
MRVSATSEPDTELYVYYSVKPADQVAALAALRHFAEQCSAAGLSFRSMRRQDSKADGTQTWMEIYHHPPAGIEKQLEAMLAESGLIRFTGPRVLEWFTSLA